MCIRDRYGIPAATVDGNDVAAVGDAVGAAVERARSGGGPTFVEALTYRLRGHYEGDPAKYRELAELADWKSKDPIARFTAALTAEGVLDAAGERVAAVERTARERVERAAEAALAAPVPSADDLLTQVHAGAPG